VDKPPQPSRHYAFVDVLRGVASLLVLLFHQQVHVFMDYPTKPIPQGSFTWWVFLGFFDLGKFAVVLFFLVSGFLIPATLRRPGATLAVFTRSRFFRLYPAYWLSLGFVLVVIAATGGWKTLRWGDVLVNVTMLQKFVGRPDLVGAYWTLQIELIFYALCAVLFRVGRLHRTDVAQWGAMGGALVCAALRGATGKPLPVALFLALTFMFAGDRLRIGDKDPALRGHAMRSAVLAVLVVVPVALLGYRDEALRYCTSYAAAMAVFLVCWRAAKAFEGEGLLRRLSRFLGDISYGMYVLSPTVLLWVGHGLHKPFENRWLTGLTVIGLSVLAAWLSWRFVERPAIAWGRRKGLPAG